MAEIQTERQRDWVQNAVDIATRLDNLLDEADAHFARYNSLDIANSGDNDTNEAVWDNNDTKHTSKEDMATLVTRIAEHAAWWAADWRRDILREVRK